MTWVKICGITNIEDALTAVEAGADALGFVFYEKSPRKVDVETARKIVAKLPAQVEKIGVFVDESVQRVRDVAGEAYLTGAQLHGSEDVSFARKLLEEAGGKLRILKVASTYLLSQRPEGKAYGWDFVSMGVLRTEDAQMFTNLLHDAGSPAAHAIQPGPFSALILDSGLAPGQGGTGKTFDWEKFRFFCDGVGRCANVIVAGGLTPANVAQAMHILHPWGVDVASGVEARPGKKDPEKVRAFIAAVREADQVH